MNDLIAAKRTANDDHHDRGSVANTSECIHMNASKMNPQRSLVKPPPMEHGIMAAHLTNLNFSFSADRDSKPNFNAVKKAVLK